MKNNYSTLAGCGDFAMTLPTEYKPYYYWDTMCGDRPGVTMGSYDNQILKCDGNESTQLACPQVDGVVSGQENKGNNTQNCLCTYDAIWGRTAATLN